MQCKDFAKDDAKKFVEQCINDYELLHQDAHYFWSNSLIRRMKKKDELSEKRRNAANKRWGNSSNNNDLTENEHASDMQSNASAMQVCAKESKEKEKKGKEKNTAQKTRNAYSPEFEEFWSVYPKKVDKKRASTSFKTAIKNNSLETILKGTKQYVEQIERNKTEAQYIKHASTFLNNESFLDELDEPRQQKNTPNAHTGIANDWEKLLEND